MKWTERWIARAQRKADARDERYRRRQAGKLPPSLIDGLAARRQATIDRREAPRQLRQEVLSRYPEFASYREASDLLLSDWPFRGPDRVEVSVWHAPSGFGPSWPELPSRWHRSRREWLFAVAGYCVSLPLKLMLLESYEVHGAYAYTMSGPPVWVARPFPTSWEALLYAALLVKRVQAGGVEALRQEALSAPAGQGGEGFGPLTWGDYPAIELRRQIVAQYTGYAPNGWAHTGRAR